MIFALPKAEAPIHPDKQNGRHELYLIRDDLKGEMALLREKGVDCIEVVEARWV